MKKLLVLFLVFALVFTFASCMGEQGPKGDKGEDGRGIVKMEIIDGCLWVTYTDAPNTPINVGKIEAEKEETVVSDLEFYPLDDGYAVGCGNSKYLSTIIIPEKHNGKPVSTILENGFKDCPNLKSITIPSSVTSIGESAFYGCSNLTSIEIPSGVTSIGESAFVDCSSLTSITLPFVGNGSDKTYFGYIFGASSYKENNSYVPSSLKNVAITGGTSIGDYAFYNCSSLTSVEIPNSVTSIGECAFSICSSLTSIEIPNSVTSIGERAFSICSSLISIEIPSSVTSIGDYAFSGCSNLTSITLPFVGNGSDKTYFGYIFGASSYDENSSCVPSSLKNVTITGGTSIGDYAFRGCSSLTSIVIPSSVTSIGDVAFSGCTSLTSIVIPNSVTSIGDSAFYGCSSLTYNKYDNAYYLGNDTNKYLVLMKAKDSTISSCEINQSTRVIYHYAFSGCSSLTNIVIPSGVTSIGERAFYYCSSLTSITLPFVGNGSDKTHFGYIFGASIYDYNNSYVPSSLKNVTITGGTSIGERAFQGCSRLTSIVIPNSVTSFGESAFQGCSSLTSIEIPSSVTSIGGNAFYNCSSLTSIEIQSGATSIGNYAFSGCSKLTSIEIPNSVTSIGDYVFRGCSSLTSIEIPSSVTSIGYHAFEGCSRLTIYCEATSKPSGWNSIWNGSNRPVKWGYNKDDIN